MSKQPHELSGWTSVIVAAFAQCEISPAKLYPYYLEERFKDGLGQPAHGEGADAFRYWMDGRSQPGINEFVFVCRTLNRRLVELGKEPMLPELPFPKASGGGGDGANLSDPEQAKGGKLTPFSDLDYVSFDAAERMKRAA